MDQKSCLYVKIFASYRSHPVLLILYSPYSTGSYLCFLLTISVPTLATTCLLYRFNWLGFDLGNTEICTVYISNVRLKRHIFITPKRRITKQPYGCILWKTKIKRKLVFFLKTPCLHVMSTSNTATWTNHVTENVNCGRNRILNTNDKIEIVEYKTANVAFFYNKNGIQ